MPESSELIEVNFLGYDPSISDASETYVFEDPVLPLMVFGPLSLLKPGPSVQVDDLVLPLPRPAGLVLEKLVTDRTGVKGERDLLVVLGLLLVASPADLDEIEAEYGRLAPELRHAVRSNLTLLSLLSPHVHMPDPQPHRELVSRLLHRLGSSA